MDTPRAARTLFVAIALTGSAAVLFAFSQLRRPEPAPAPTPAPFNDANDPVFLRGRVADLLGGNQELSLKLGQMRALAEGQRALLDRLLPSQAPIPEGPVYEIRNPFSSEKIVYEHEEDLRMDEIMRRTSSLSDEQMKEAGCLPLHVEGVPKDSRTLMGLMIYGHDSLRELLSGGGVDADEFVDAMLTSNLPLHQPIIRLCAVDGGVAMAFSHPSPNKSLMMRPAYWNGKTGRTTVSDGYFETSVDLYGTFLAQKIDGKVVLANLYGDAGVYEWRYVAFEPSLNGAAIIERCIEKFMNPAESGLRQVICDVR